MIGLTVLGWGVILLITLYCLKQTFNIFRVSMGFTGRLCGEFYVMAVISGLLVWLSYYTWPFNVTIGVAG